MDELCRSLSNAKAEGNEGESVRLLKSLRGKIFEMARRHTEEQ